MADLDARYPALSDLHARARARLPRFVWDYLDCATGTEATPRRNRAQFDRIGFMPSILHGDMEFDIGRDFLGHRFAMPFGISPIGMAGLIWPDAEGHLARAGKALDIPFCLSTVASQTPEDVGPHLGPHSWFQLYPPRDPDIRRDMLDRARRAGFSTLVLTADVPVASRRERQVRSGLTQPPRLTPRLLAQVAIRPEWALGMLRNGMPRMRTLDKYITAERRSMSPTAHVGYLLRTSGDWDYLRWLRDEWDGPLIVKGILRKEDCAPLEAAGVDALWVSNHAGRQFDAAPAPIEVLPAIRAATKLPIILDSGIQGGLDILRAISRGADFVMLGRAWPMALAALGPQGLVHLADMLAKDIRANMGQLGAPDLDSLPPEIALD